jgi:hypothetical protein
MPIKTSIGILIPTLVRQLAQCLEYSASNTVCWLKQ